MFESVEEVDQIEAETKNEEAKQMPKMPNGALQNETSSPDSGHPSSRNFSITSGLSDGSLSTEDSSAPDATQRCVVVLQASQSSVKAAGGESEALTGRMDTQVIGVEQDRGEEKALDGTKIAKKTKTEVKDENLDEKETSFPTETQESTRSETVQIEGTSFDTKMKETKPSQSLEPGKEVSEENTMTVTATAMQLKGEHVEDNRQKEVVTERASKLEETNVNKIKEIDKSKSTEVLQTQEKDKIFKGPEAPEVEKNLVLSTDTTVSETRGAYCSSQMEKAQMTESDESPSAIEMEEIPKAKVSMVPWSKKGHCETLSSFEDSALHMELRQNEGKLSPEGTESNLSEPEMESLYPPFDSTSTSENTKTEVASGESSGSAYSVCMKVLKD